MAALFLFLCSLILSAFTTANAARNLKHIRSAGQTRTLTSAKGPSASEVRRALVEEHYSDIPLDYGIVNTKLIGGYPGPLWNSLYWSQCLNETNPIYLNSICIVRSKMNDSRFISQLTFGFTDGTYHNIGCGSQGQISCYYYNAAQNYEISWDCININVAGGERITTIGFSEHLGHVSMFDLQTTRPDGSHQSLESSFKYFSGGGNMFHYSAAELGSGVACGYQAWAGNVIDNIGIIFLNNFRTEWWPDSLPTAQLPPDADTRPETFTGRFLCPTAGANVCTHSSAHQYGTVGSTSISSSNSLTIAGMEKVTIGYEWKDVGKIQASATFKQESTSTDTSGTAWTSTMTESDQNDVYCICPQAIPDNTFCTFEFSTDYRYQYSAVPFSGKAKLIMLDSNDVPTGRVVNQTIRGAVTGTTTSGSLYQSSISCESTFPPPAPPPPPPPLTSQACFTYSGDTPLSIFGLGPDMSSTSDCRSACINDRKCDGYKFCDASTLLRDCAPAPIIKCCDAPSLLMSALQAPAAAPLTDGYFTDESLLTQGNDYIEPVMMVGGSGGNANEGGATYASLSRCMNEGDKSPYFVNWLRVCYTYDTRGEFRYIYFVALKFTDGTSEQFGNFGSPTVNMACNELTIDVAGGERVVQFSLSIAHESNQTLDAGGYYTSSINIETLKLDGKSQTLKQASGGKLFSANVGSGLICGVARRSGAFVDRMGFIFMRPVVSTRTVIPPVVLGVDDSASPDAIKVQSDNFICTKAGSSVGAFKATYSYGASISVTNSHTDTFFHSEGAGFFVEYKGFTGALEKFGMGSATASFEGSVEVKRTSSSTSGSAFTGTTINTLTTTVPKICPLHIPDNTTCTFTLAYSISKSLSQQIAYNGSFIVTLDSGKEMVYPANGFISNVQAYSEIVSMVSVICDVPPPPPLSLPPSPSPPPVETCFINSIYTQNRTISVPSDCDCYSSCKLDGACTSFKFCPASDRDATCKARLEVNIQDKAAVDLYNTQCGLVA